MHEKWVVAENGKGVVDLKCTEGVGLVVSTSFV